MRTARIAALALFFTTLSAASMAHPLTPEKASELEYRLENLNNELELLIRNHPADEADVEKQERQLKEARAFERVPWDSELPRLRQDLGALGRAHGVELVELRVLNRGGPPSKIPRALYSDQTSFRLGVKDVVETIAIRVVVASNDAELVDGWARTWQRQLLRIIDPEGQAGFRSFPDGQGHRTVDARIYRFRRVIFPSVRPRNPIQLLPAYARRDLEGFSRAEPRLWKYVTRIRELSPEAEALYPVRGRFLVNDARLTFLLSKLTSERVK